MLFFAMASYYPLLGKYYKELHFSGTQIGLLFSAATFITMCMQPIWGAICDKRGRCKEIFLLMHLAIIVISLVLPFIQNFSLLLLMVILHFAFQSGLFPLIDTMIYKDIHDFGAIRLWGSIGFALMVLFSGKISEVIGLRYMFFIYSFLMVFSLIISSKIQELKNDALSNKFSINSIKELFRKRYILFLLMGIFIMGVFSTGNVYFSILFSDKNGSMTAFGITYFLLAVSEVPFLRVSTKIIKKYGVENVIFFSGLILLSRFLLYGTAKSHHVLIYSSIVMGSFVGLMLPAVAVFLKENTKIENRATAVTLYYSVCTGFSPMIFQFLGGIVYEYKNISILYFSLSSLVIIGIIISFVLKNTSKKTSKTITRKIGRIW